MKLMTTLSASIRNSPPRISPKQNGWSKRRIPPQTPPPPLAKSKSVEGLPNPFPQKKVLAKPRPPCSVTCPNTWRAEHQRKMSFPFSRKISPPPNQESKRHFSLVLPSEARQWRNDAFHIGIFLEKSSDFVQEI